MKRKESISLFEYLRPYIQSGDKAAIAEARKQYAREYKAVWRREKRKREKEVTTSWKPEELRKLTAEAKRHKTNRAGFLKQAALAYMDMRYIPADQAQASSIMQLLGKSYNAIALLEDEKQILPAECATLLEMLSRLEQDVREALYNPKSLEEFIREAITQQPHQKQIIAHLLETLP